MRSQSQAIQAEAKKTKETAERLANGDYPDGADHIRVLAGMISQLAEQIERLASPGSVTSDGPGNDRHADPDGPEVEPEEDRTPEDAPAEPADDRATS